MRKILLTALATALFFSSAASAANLMIDEQSKKYNPQTAIFEINDSITAVGTCETGAMKLTIKPFFHSFVMSGNIKNGSSIDDNGLPYKKPVSMLKKANGYIFKAKGKEAVTESIPLAGVILTAENKAGRPLIIDMDKSVMQLDAYQGPVHFLQDMKEAGSVVPSKLMVPPKETKTFLLFRSDATYRSTSTAATSSTGYFLPATSVDFNNLHAELALKVNGKYVSLIADGAIPENIQKKYDQAAQMAAMK